MPKVVTCCLCGHPLNSAACPHPWNKPFDQWPGHLHEQVRQAARGAMP